MERQADRSYDQLIGRFVRWAESCSDIRAAVIVGSRARVHLPADEWSDLDVVMVTTNPEHYVSTRYWLSSIGNLLLTFVEPTSTGDEMERRALFENMLDVDFAVIPAGKVKLMLQSGIPSQEMAQFADTFGRGIRVLLDKDGLTARLKELVSSIKKPVSEPPTQKEFLQVVNDFLYHAVFTAKHLRRGELWWAKMTSDCYMQRLLLRLIEWHAHVLHGWDYDTWFRGRFLEKWADPRILELLHGAFAHYDQADTKRGLQAVLDLFRTVAVEISEELKYSYPIESDRQVSEWIGKCILEK